MSEVKLALRVHFVDDSFKTVAVNSTITADELCAHVAEKINLKMRETFSLFYMKNDEGRCLDDDEQPCKLMVTESIGPEADFVKYTERMEWEKLKKEWEQTSKLVFKRRVFLKHKPITKEDPEFLKYSYLQAVANVNDGTYPCSEADALELAGLQMQASFSDYNKKIHVPGFLKDLKKFIPSPLLETGTRKNEDWEKDIYFEHSKLLGLKSDDAMLHYLNKVRQWPFYGCSFWHVQTVNKESTSLPDNVILAVSSTGIQLLRLGYKDPLLIQRYADIYSWAYKRNAFAFVSGVLSKQKFQFITPHGKDIARTLQAYVEILLEERKKKDSKPEQTTSQTVE